MLGVFFTVTDLLRRWQYAVPLVVNLTGSVWFFVVVGRAGRLRFFSRALDRVGGDRIVEEQSMADVWDVELSLTVPITNSLAFLFTVLGEWWAEGKVIGRGEFSSVFANIASRQSLTEETDTWIGMACVLAGIGLCVQSKLS